MRIFIKSFNWYYLRLQGLNDQVVLVVQFTSLNMLMWVIMGMTQQKITSWGFTWSHKGCSGNINTVQSSQQLDVWELNRLSLYPLYKWVSPITHTAVLTLLIGITPTTWNACFTILVYSVFTSQGRLNVDKSKSLASPYFTLVQIQNFKFRHLPRGKLHVKAPTVYPKQKFFYELSCHKAVRDNSLRQWSYIMTMRV